MRAPAASLRARNQADEHGAPVLDLQSLTAGYRKSIIALRDVSLSVACGEMLAVVGPNGSGKSTLLRVASGVLAPLAGRVLVAGHDVQRYSRRELARLTAVVPQDTLVEFPFSVEELVLMGRAPHLGRFGFPGARDLSIAREAMLTVGCLQTQKCHTGHCPTGVATQNRWLTRALLPDDKAPAFARYVRTLRRDLLKVGEAAGLQHPALISTSDIEILYGDANALPLHKVAGYEPEWGQPGAADRAEIERIMVGLHGGDGSDGSEDEAHHAEIPAGEER